jgi:geranylgeranyl reductase family protein
MPRRVIIVGAGPGGTAAAIRLASRGVQEVLLLDRDVFPRDKTCGSALSPNGVRLARELGIGAEIAQRGYPIRALRLKTPGGREMHLASEEAAVILLRRDFDHLLLERARSQGVTFEGGVRVTGVIEERGRVVGVRTRDSELRADYVLCADGAHSIFSRDPRPRRTISTLMGWWEGVAFEPNTLEMVFDRQLAPLYGWLFPETPTRVNIGICLDGELADGSKQPRNVRHVFERFLDDHFRARLSGAQPVGRWKGHPISYTYWIDHCASPGALFLGEAARITHNATGEGIYHAMQSGMYAADTLADVITGTVPEAQAFRRYTWTCRRRFTTGFAMGQVMRTAFRTPLLDTVATLYNSPVIRRAVNQVLGSALAGSQISSREAAHAAPAPH